MITLGFSINDFYYWPNKRLNFLLKNIKIKIPQANAIELHANHSIDEILKNISLIKKFQYRTFHLPKSGYVRWVKELNKHQANLKLNHLIIHPNTINNWQPLTESKIPVLIENMDNRKNSFNSPKDFTKLFKKYPNLNLCLDVNHLYSNNLGPTTKWLDKFKSKIGEIHLSTLDKQYYKKWSIRGTRHALCYYDQSVLDTKRIKNYPIILEGLIPPKRWDLAKQEFELVKKFLK